MMNASEKSSKGSKKNGQQAAQDEAETSKSQETVKLDPKVLFASIRELEGKATQLQLQMDDLNAKRSAVIGQIQQTSGTGPFQIAGVGLVTIRSRKSKVEGKGDTYFFVTMGKREVTVID